MTEHMCMVCELCKLPFWILWHATQPVAGFDCYVRFGGFATSDACLFRQLRVTWELFNSCKKYLSFCYNFIFKYVTIFQHGVFCTVCNITWNLNCISAVSAFSSIECHIKCIYVCILPMHWVDSYFGIHVYKCIYFCVIYL